MNTLSRFAASVTALADSGFDPVGAATLVELRDAVVAKSRAIDANTPPSEILAVISLVEELEAKLDQLAAEHQAAA